jgi:hypothetical protein
VTALKIGAFLQFTKLGICENTTVRLSGVTKAQGDHSIGVVFGLFGEISERRVKVMIG